MKETTPVSFSREMGLTQVEFMRTLPAAIAPFQFQMEGHLISIVHPAGSILIRLHETLERRIASLQLPVTQVDFRFEGLQPDQREAFMRRFDLCFQRGGG